MAIKEIIGDKQIQDLTPKTTNIGNRLVKNMRICGSGIYTYARQEADLLHLTPVPEKYKNLQYINVYRPAEVLEANKDKFARVPIITGRHVLVDQSNAKELTVGMVGDTVESEVDKDDGETYLYTTGTIVAGDGVDAYEQYGQLSVGYDPIIAWEEGVHKGVQYQAVLKGFNDVNHLLICKIARGGPQCMVMDSLDEFSPLERFVNKYNGGKKMGIFQKIFGTTSKDKSLGDSNSLVVSTLLQSIAVGADPACQVEKIRQLVGDSDITFNGYLDELAGAKGEDLSIVSKAVEIVNEYFQNHFVAGDEKTVGVKKENKDGKEEKKVEVKEDGKETKDIEVKKDGDKKEVEVKEMGDSAKAPGCGDSIDYDLIATKVAGILSKKKEAPMNGDSMVNEYSMVIAGDTAEGSSSDDYFKDVFGGN